MKQVTATLYEYSELSPKAKENAKYQFSDDWDGWCYARVASLHAAQKLYKLFDTDEEISGVRLYKFIQNKILPELERPLKLKKTLQGDIEFYLSDEIYQNEKARLSNINSGCEALNLTGYCDDYEFLQPIFDFIKNPKEGITNKSITSHSLRDTDLTRIWGRIVDNERDYFFEDANFAEHCEVNGYFFTEDGQLA